jgi:arsenical pump membrane protein
MGVLLGVAAGTAALLRLGPPSASDSVAQAWPAFALVTGLLLIGRVAAQDDLFAAAGSRIAALPGGPAALLAGMLGLVAATTVVLNLDTAVVFLTPVAVQLARARGLDHRAFVYGAVFMSNSASLLLPGSNLTNLLVLDGARVSGLDYARLMLVPWQAAVMVTWLLMWAMQRRTTSPHRTGRAAGAVRIRGRLGVAAVGAAAVVVLLVHDPAIPVLVIGVASAAWRLLRRRIDLGSVLRSLPVALAGLFVLAVSAGSLARLWTVPATVAATAGRLASALLGAAGAVTVNNLPAAMLLTSHPPAHPLFLLLGLNLGPNLVITGSLSAVLWRRLARENGAEVSVTRYVRLGLIVVPLTLAAAVAGLVVSIPAA